MAIFRTADSESGSSAQDQAASTVLRLKDDDREELRVSQRLSIDYFKKRMLADVESELLDRFPSAQYSSSGGQAIQPVAIPLTHRFVTDQATAYNKGVTRRFVDEDGQESDATKEQTAKFNKAAARARYDEVLHANDQFTVLLETMTVLPQMKRGHLKLSSHFPYTVYPIAPVDEPVEPSDPDDYEAFVIETTPDQEDVTKAGGKMFVLLEDHQRTFYRGYGPGKLDHMIEQEPNTTKFMHYNDAGKKVDAVGRMLTFWHNALTPDELIVHSDATVAELNREVNILYSIIFDTLRFQGHSTPVLNSASKDTLAAKMRHGSRFPVILGPKQVEEFHYAVSAAPYEEMVGVLQNFTKFIAIMMRQSPNDFSTESQGALSGIAKRIDSLPKLEAREERIRALTWIEEYELSPRVIGVMVQAGDLDASAKQMRLVTEFAGVEFPLSEEERAKKLETDMKFGLTTPAKILAKEKGISLEDAQAEIEENKTGSTEALGQPGALQPAVDPLRASLTSLISKRKKPMETNGDEGTEDG